VHQTAGTGAARPSSAPANAAEREPSPNAWLIWTTTTEPGPVTRGTPPTPANTCAPRHSAGVELAEPRHRVEAALPVPGVVGEEELVGSDSTGSPPRETPRRVVDHPQPQLAAGFGAPAQFGDGVVDPVR
jgi:hypothetical protein